MNRGPCRHSVKRVMAAKHPIFLQKCTAQQKNPTTFLKNVPKLIKLKKLRLTSLFAGDIKNGSIENPQVCEREVPTKMALYEHLATAW